MTQKLFPLLIISLFVMIASPIVMTWIGGMAIDSAADLANAIGTK